MDAYFGNRRRHHRVRRLFGPPAARGRRLRALQRRSLLESFGDDYIVSPFLDLVHARGDAIHHFVHALAIGRELLGETGQLRVEAQSQEIQH
jgi:hypothetical protein